MGKLLDVRDDCGENIRDIKNDIFLESWRFGEKCNDYKLGESWVDKKLGESWNIKYEFFCKLIKFL